MCWIAGWICSDDTLSAMVGSPSANALISMFPSWSSARAELSTIAAVVCRFSACSESA